MYMYCGVISSNAFGSVDMYTNWHCSILYGTMVYYYELDPFFHFH